VDIEDVSESDAEGFVEVRPSFASSDEREVNRLNAWFHAPAAEEQWWSVLGRMTGAELVALHDLSVLRDEKYVSASGVSNLLREYISLSVRADRHVANRWRLRAGREGPAIYALPWADIVREPRAYDDWPGVPESVDAWHRWRRAYVANERLRTAYYWARRSLLTGWTEHGLRDGVRLRENFSLSWFWSRVWPGVRASGLDLPEWMNDWESSEYWRDVDYARGVI
jgi:hypothetical protein